MFSGASVVEKIIWGVIGCLVASVLFVCTDCGCGHTVTDDGTVLGRFYEPPHTETYWVSDGKNGMRPNTTYHAESFNVTVQTLTHGTRTFSTDQQSYNIAATPNAHVSVKWRQGRWSSSAYYGTLAPYGQEAR